MQPRSGATLESDSWLAQLATGEGCAAIAWAEYTSDQRAILQLVDLPSGRTETIASADAPIVAVDTSCDFVAWSHTNVSGLGSEAGITRLDRPTRRQERLTSFSDKSLAYPADRVFPVMQLTRGGALIWASESTEASSDGHVGITILQSNVAGTKTVLARFGDVSDMALSPDGSALAVGGAEGFSDAHSLWLVDVASGRRRLVWNQGDVQHITWSSAEGGYFEAKDRSGRGIRPRLSSAEAYFDWLNLPAGGVYRWDSDGAEKLPAVLDGWAPGELQVSNAHRSIAVVGWKKPDRGRPQASLWLYDLQSREASMLAGPYQHLHIDAGFSGDGGSLLVGASTGSSEDESGFVFDVASGQSYRLNRAGTSAYGAFHALAWGGEGKDTALFFSDMIDRGTAKRGRLAMWSSRGANDFERVTVRPDKIE